MRVDSPRIAEFVFGGGGGGVLDIPQSPPPPKKERGNPIFADVCFIAAPLSPTVHPIGSGYR